MTYNGTPLDISRLARRPRSQEPNDYCYCDPRMQLVFETVAEHAEELLEGLIAAADIQPGQPLSLALNEDEALQSIPLDLQGPEEITVALRTIATVYQDHQFITSLILDRVQQLYPEECKKGAKLNIGMVSGN